MSGGAPPGGRGRERRPGCGVPTVLVRLFGTDRVCSLHAALRHLLSAAAPRLETLRRGDSREYRRLLRRTLVVTVPPRPLWRELAPVPQDTCTQRRCTQADVLNRAIDAVRRQHTTAQGQLPNNVLVAGDAPHSGGGGALLLTAGPPPPPPAPGGCEWTRINCGHQELQVRVGWARRRWAVPGVSPLKNLTCLPVLRSSLPTLLWLATVC